MIPNMQLMGICCLALLALYTIALASFPSVIPASVFLLVPSILIGLGAVGIPVLLYAGFTWLCFRFRLERAAKDQVAIPFPSWSLFIFSVGLSGYYHFSGLMRPSIHFSDAMIAWYDLAFVCFGLLALAGLLAASLTHTNRGNLIIVTNALVFFWIFTFGFPYLGDLP